MRKLVLGCSAAAFAMWGSCLLAGAASAEQPKQGGRMTLTYKDDVSTLDPAIGYDWQNPSLMQAIFDGLMDYKPARSSSPRISPRSTPSPTTARPTASSFAAG